MEVETDNSYTANGCIVHNCTDISNAGQQKGLEEGSGTRSSLLWECCKTIESKRPKYLLMENVKALVSQKFLPFYKKWEQYLAEMGYDNYCMVMNAKDYGVPQNRERIFIVSILDNDQSFRFPSPIPLEKRLKDVLEPEVDDKYVLSDQAIEGFLKHNENHEAKGTGFL
jgi:DNA (cytosine-5)-methyltransferase 1